MPRVGLDQGTVVAAAVALADTEGLAAVTLAKVAQRLGVKSPSLYVHVDGLAGLRRQIAIQGAQGIAEALQDAVAGRAGRDALAALATSWREYARVHPGTYAATQDVANLAGPEGAAAAAAALDIVFAVLRGYKLEADAATHAARAIRSAVHGFVALEVGGGFGIDLDLDDSFELLVDLLDQGLRSPDSGFNAR